MNLANSFKNTPIKCRKFNLICLNHLRLIHLMYRNHSKHSQLKPTDWFLHDQKISLKLINSDYKCTNWFPNNILILARARYQMETNMVCLHALRNYAEVCRNLRSPHRLQNHQVKVTFIPLFFFSFMLSVCYTRISSTQLLLSNMRHLLMYPFSRIVVLP